jgi:hypothetical protein
MTHVLTWMTFLPLLGVVVILCLPAERATLIKRVALGFTLPTFGLGLWLFAAFDRGLTSFQYVDRLPWIASYNIEYFVGIDGLSIAMVLLTALLTLYLLLRPTMNRMNQAMRALPLLGEGLFVEARGAFLGRTSRRFRDEVDYLADLTYALANTLENLQVQSRHHAASLQAQAAKNSPPIVVAAEGTSAPPFGEPFVSNLDMRASQEKSSTFFGLLDGPVKNVVRLSLKLEGAAKERVTAIWHVEGKNTKLALDRSGRRPKEPQYTVATPKGEMLNEGVFTYG